MNRFPDFGKELARPYAVHENCYDCAEFYWGCAAWPVAKEFACLDRLRLPDVKAGTTGQVIPPSRMRARTEPRAPAPEPKMDVQTHRRAIK